MCRSIAMFVLRVKTQQSNIAILESLVTELVFVVSHVSEEEAMEVRIMEKRRVVKGSMRKSYSWPEVSSIESKQKELTVTPVLGGDKR